MEGGGREQPDGGIAGCGLSRGVRQRASEFDPTSRSVRLLQAAI